MIPLGPCGTFTFDPLEPARGLASRAVEPVPCPWCNWITHRAATSEIRVRIPGGGHPAYSPLTYESAEANLELGSSSVWSSIRPLKFEGPRQCRGPSWLSHPEACGDTR